MAKHWLFRKEWRSNSYHTGDMYHDDQQQAKRKSWEISKEEAGPYLKYVDRISSEWPQLKLLVDFMKVGTDPVRWEHPDLHNNDKSNTYAYSKNKDERRSQQLERCRRTRVCQLNYLDDGTAYLVDTYTDPEQLHAALQGLKQHGERTPREGDEGNGEHVKLRLFVVEDLSREVIEQLGDCFDIDPDFFRAHILDNAWFNIRDPFYKPPYLHMDTVRNDWFEIRFCRARYFSSQEQLNRGHEEAIKFNVGRRLDGDENKAFWDRTPKQKAAAKIPPFLEPWLTELTKLLVDSNARLTEWLRKYSSTRKNSTVDEEGRHDGHNVSSTSSNGHGGEAGAEKSGETDIDARVGLMRTRATFWRKRGWAGVCDIGVLLLDPTIEGGFPLWRGYRNWNRKPSREVTDHDLQSFRVPSLTRSLGGGAAAKASFFEDFIYWAQKRDVAPPRGGFAAIDVYHTHMVPLLRLVCAEWLTLSQYIKTRLSQMDWENAHPKEFLTQTQIDDILKKLHTWRRLVPVYREMLSETQLRVFQFHGLDAPNHWHGSASKTPRPLDAYRNELSLVLEAMEEYEKRIDRLTAVVTSAINTVDSRRVERLTRLATLFVPLSLVGTLFSMSEDIAKIRETFGYWAAASLVLSTLLHFLV